MDLVLGIILLLLGAVVIGISAWWVVTILGWILVGVGIYRIIVALTNRRV